MPSEVTLKMNVKVPLSVSHMLNILAAKGTDVLLLCVKALLSKSELP